MSYDPALDLVYYGVGNPSPYNAEQRVGDNKWTASVLARHPGDGSLVWAYQFTPHDNWDYDAVSTMILADVKIGGQVRKALVTFNKNGFQYTLDRATGEVLSAPPYVQVTWAKSIDLKTGRPVLDSTKQTGASKGNVKGVCPSLEGGVSPASPAAFSPRTGLFYTSTNNMCMDYAAVPAQHLRGTPFIGAGTPYYAGPGGNLGAFMAWDASTGKKVWEDKEHFPNWSGALVTAGDVAFYGTLDGWFKAVDAKTGKLLSSSKSAPASWATRSRIAALTASSTWRSMPASAAIGFCSRGMCAPTIPPTCGRRPIHTRTSDAIPARAASSGFSRSSREETLCQTPD
jgi:PQQ-dependent dehydrogenase (methanol/ethanol family)